MPSTYTPIATTTLGSSSTSVSFSSISSAYTDLILVLNLKATSAGSTDINVNFNSDTSSLYSRTYLAGNGTSALSARSSNTTTIQINNWSAATSGNTNYNAILNIMNYSNTTTFKTVLVRTNNADNAAESSVNLYRSTSALSSIQITPGASRAFDTGSTFTLYGVKSA
jgi:hypothetical protein